MSDGVVLKDQEQLKAMVDNVEFAEHNGITPTEERRLVRRIDFW